MDRLLPNRHASDDESPGRRHNVGQQPTPDLKTLKLIQIIVRLDGCELQDLVIPCIRASSFRVVENVRHRVTGVLTNLPFVMVNDLHVLLEVGAPQFVSQRL